MNFAFNLALMSLVIVSPSHQSLAGKLLAVLLPVSGTLFGVGKKLRGTSIKMIRGSFLGGAESESWEVGLTSCTTVHSPWGTFERNQIVGTDVRRLLF